MENHLSLIFKALKKTSNTDIFLGSIAKLFEDKFNLNKNFDIMKNINYLEKSNDFQFVYESKNKNTLKFNEKEIEAVEKKYHTLSYDLIKKLHSEIFKNLKSKPPLYYKDEFNSLLHNYVQVIFKIGEKILGLSLETIKSILTTDKQKPEFYLIALKVLNEIYEKNIDKFKKENDTLNDFVENNYKTIHSLIPFCEDIIGIGVIGVTHYPIKVYSYLISQPLEEFDDEVEIYEVDETESENDMGSPITKIENEEKISKRNLRKASFMIKPTNSPKTPSFIFKSQDEGDLISEDTSSSFVDSKNKNVVEIETIENNEIIKPVSKFSDIPNKRKSITNITRDTELNIQNKEKQLIHKKYEKFNKIKKDKEIYISILSETIRLIPYFSPESFFKEISFNNITNFIGKLLIINDKKVFLLNEKRFQHHVLI
jgi:hypothetical protein